MNIRTVADKKVEGVLMGRKGETPEPRGGEGQLMAHFGNGGMASLPLSRNCENFSILGGLFVLLDGSQLEAKSQRFGCCLVSVIMLRAVKNKRQAMPV